MSSKRMVERVVVVVLDGLRADAPQKYRLPALADLAAAGASSFSARTVRPSVTAAAMTSLLSGVAPEVHGMRSDRFGVPSNVRDLHPLPRVLAEAGLPSSAFLKRVPWSYLWAARRIARAVGVTRPHFGGRTAAEILGHALPALLGQKRGWIFLHWPDADDAGHAHGWDSPEYGEAAAALDRALGVLASVLRLSHDASTLLIACADHGGGGATRYGHDSEHPDDTTVPLLLAGRAVTPGTLRSGAGLLDVPATVLWALGVERPANYAGSPLAEAFEAASLRVERAA